MALAVALAVSSSACASQPPLRADAYYNDAYSYRVAYISPGYLASADWILENFQVDEGGRPTTPKTGPDYRGRFRADLDGDGDLEDAGEIALYDLRFVHKKTAARLWVSAIPISQTHAETDLAVLAKAFVESVAGTGLRVEQIGDTSVGEQRTYATRILQENASRIDDMPAHRVTFEMASVDQLELDPKSRWQRVSVAFVRPGFFWTTTSAKRLNELFPVILLVGYESAPEHFDAGMAELEALLKRIYFAPTEFAADTRDIIACGGGKEPVSLVVTKTSILSPDLTADQTECVRKMLEERHWPLNSVHKSYVFRSKDAPR